MNNIKDFKIASETINSYRKDIKSEMDKLTRNLYSMLNQLNFSTKLIIDTNHFISKYIDSEKSVSDRLKASLGTVDITPTMNLYNNMAFNDSFISGVLAVNNFSKILNEAISNFLAKNELSSGTNNNTKIVTLEKIHGDYCKEVFIRNDWKAYRGLIGQFNKNHQDSFKTPTWIIDVETMTASQKTLHTQYKGYKNVFDDLELIFMTDSMFSINELRDNLIPALKRIINFKTISIFYNRYLDKIGMSLEEATELFERIKNYVGDLSKANKEYQPTFEQDNKYIDVMFSICSLSSDLIASLMFKYPNKESKQKLILDGDFTKVLSTINNLFKKELETSVDILRTASRDYKLIRSLETFVTPDKSIDNSIFYNIMSDYDNQLFSTYIQEVTPTLRLSSLIRLYFDEQVTNSSDIFGKESFTKVLHSSLTLTDPFYDILNYHRLSLFTFNKDASLIFDFLETLQIFNRGITNQGFINDMADLFKIKIDNVDYININTSKISETISSRYPNMNKLNYFDIDPYVKEILKTNMNVIDDKTDNDVMVFAKSLFKDLKAYDIIIFAITEIILYDDIDLSLVMKQLSVPLNIRTILFKILFAIAMDGIMLEVLEHVSNVIDDAEKIDIYNDIIINKTNLVGDLKYLELLTSANAYYSGKTDKFNIKNISNLIEPDKSIWDFTKIDQIKRLLAIHKEV